MQDLEKYSHNVENLCQKFVIHNYAKNTGTERYGPVEITTSRYGSVVYMKGEGFTISSDYDTRGGEICIYKQTDSNKFSFAYYRKAYEKKNLRTDCMRFLINPQSYIDCELTEENHFQMSLVHNVPSLEEMKTVRALIDILYEKYPDVHSAYFLEEVGDLELL